MVDMPTQPIPKRPQTTRQAKRAYQKRSAIPRVSEAESRRLARAEEADQRAKRLREAAKTKAANAKKRVEKEAAEREKRKSLGANIPFGKISASQRPLTNFLRPCVSSRNEALPVTEPEGVAPSPANSECTGANSSIESLSPAPSHAQESHEHEEFAVNTDKANRVRGNDSAGLVTTAKATVLNDHARTPRAANAARLSLRPPMRLEHVNTNVRLVSTRSQLVTPEPDDWEDLLESNSQIARELENENETPRAEKVESTTSLASKNKISYMHPPALGQSRNDTPNNQDNTLIPTSPLVEDTEIADNFLCYMTTQDLDDIGSSPLRSKPTEFLTGGTGRANEHTTPAAATANDSFDYGIFDISADDWATIEPQLHERDDLDSMI
jgi:hypothetical protein